MSGDAPVRIASFERLAHLGLALGRPALVQAANALMHSSRKATLFGLATDGRVVQWNSHGHPVLLNPEEEAELGLEGILLRPLPTELAKVPHQEPVALRRVLQETAVGHLKGKVRARATEALESGLAGVYDLYWDDLQAVGVRRSVRRAGARAERNAAIEQMKKPVVVPGWLDPEKQGWH